MEASERREYPREDCHITINFIYEDKAHTEFILNISKGGIFIDSNEQIPSGHALILTYDSPQQVPTKHIGQVAWANSGGMGIRLPKGGGF